MIGLCTARYMRSWIRFVLLSTVSLTCYGKTDCRDWRRKCTVSLWMSTFEISTISSTSREHTRYEYVGTEPTNQTLLGRRSRIRVMTDTDSLICRTQSTYMSLSWRNFGWGVTRTDCKKRKRLRGDLESLLLSESKLYARSESYEKFEDSEIKTKWTSICSIHASLPQISCRYTLDTREVDSIYFIVRRKDVRQWMIWDPRLCNGLCRDPAVVDMIIGETV